MKVKTNDLTEKPVRFPCIVEDSMFIVLALNTEGFGIVLKSKYDGNDSWALTYSNLPWTENWDKYTLYRGELTLSNK